MAPWRPAGGTVPRLGDAGVDDAAVTQAVLGLASGAR